MLEEYVAQAVDLVVPIVEGIGALVIFAGVLTAFAAYVLSQVGIRPTSYNRVRLKLGRFLALGLEFQLGADILATAVAPTFEEIGKLGAIATIRTALNFFLGRELREEAEREQMREGRGDPGASAARGPVGKGGDGTGHSEPVR